MIGLVKSHLNLSDYSQFIFKKGCEVNKKNRFIIARKKMQVIIFMIIVTRSSERIFIPMRYTDVSWTCDVCRPG